MTDGQASWSRGFPDLKDSGLYGEQDTRRWSLPPDADADADAPGRSRELPSRMSPLGALVKRVPDWDRAVVPPIQPEFTEWLALSGVPVISVTRLPDFQSQVSRYVLVRPCGELGRYQVQFAFPLTETSWMTGVPRPRMDIRAALELVARLVAESA